LFEFEGEAAEKIMVEPGAIGGRKRLAGKLQEHAFEAGHGE
jgi:hypothetical protein